MEEDELNGSDKRSRSPTDLPAGPAGTKTGATPPPAGFVTGQSDGEKSDEMGTAKLIQDLVQAAVPKLNSLARSGSQDTLALNGEARRPSPPPEEYYHYSSDDYSSWPSEASSWLSEDSTAPSQHASVQQQYFFEYGSAAQTFSSDSSPSPRSSPEKGTSGDGTRQERKKANKSKVNNQKRAEGGGAEAVQGKGLSLELCTGSSLMALEDVPAITAASSALHEREPRFVRRCGQACRHYAMWRMKKENAVLALGASLLRKSIEAILSVAPLVLAALLLLYCFSMEEPDTWDREIVSIPLLNAAESGDAGQVELLLNNGANIEQRNYYGLTALHRASEEGKVPVVKLLLSRGAEVLTLDCDGQSALEKAAQQGHKRTVGLLARWGGDVHFRDSMGYNLVMRAAEWGWHHVILTLLASARGREELDSRDLFDETPLLKAARNGRKQMVSTLLKLGASVTAVDKEENTALLWVVRHEWSDLISLVLKSAPAGGLPQHELNRALAVAVKRGLTSVATLLLGVGADAAVRDGHGHTLVMKAAQGGHAAVARVLLKQTGLGLVDAVNARGQTALMLAAEREGTVKAAKVLVARRAKLDVQDRQGETALFKAVAHGNLPLSRLLLAKGADPTLRDKHGTVALRRAAMEGQRELVSVLVSRQPRLSAWELLGELAATPAEALQLRKGFTANTPDRPHPPPLDASSILAWIHRDPAEEEMLEVWEEGGASEWGHCDGDGECGPDGLVREEAAEKERRGVWARVGSVLGRWRRGDKAGEASGAGWSGVEEAGEEGWGRGEEEQRASALKGGRTHLELRGEREGEREGWGVERGGGVGAGWCTRGLCAAALRLLPSLPSLPSLNPLPSLPLPFRRPHAQEDEEEEEEEARDGKAEGMWWVKRKGVRAEEGLTVLGVRVVGRAAAAALLLLRDTATALLPARPTPALHAPPPAAACKPEAMEMKPWTEAGAPEVGPWWRWRGGGMGVVKRWLRHGRGSERGEASCEVRGEEVAARAGWRERVAGWVGAGAWVREALVAGSEHARLPGAPASPYNNATPFPRRRSPLRLKAGAGGEEEGWMGAVELTLKMPSDTACLVERVLLPWLPFQPSSQLCTLRHQLIDYILEYGEQLHRVEMEQLGIGGEEEEEEDEEELSLEGEGEESEEGGGYDAGVGEEAGVFGEEEPRDEGWEDGEAEPGAIPYAVIHPAYAD